MNRKIAISGFSVVTALTLLTTSAFAAFTTSASATGNTFSTTTPNLEVQVNGTGFGSSVPGATVNGLIPGTPGATQTFEVKNNDINASGDIPVSLQLSLGVANTLSGGDLTITVNCGGSDIVDTFNGWLSAPHALGTVPHDSGVVGANVLTCTMIPELNSGVGNGSAGKSAVFDAVFTGTLGDSF